MKMNLEECDKVILDGISLDASLKVESDNLMKSYGFVIKNMVVSSLIARELEKISKDNPGYGKLLADRDGYSNREALIRETNAMMDKNVALFEIGGFKCPRSGKDCKKDDKTCFFENYATAINASTEIAKRFPLKDYEIDALKHNITSFLIKCNPNIGQLVVVYGKY